MCGFARHRAGASSAGRSVTFAKISPPSFLVVGHERPSVRDPDRLGARTLGAALWAATWILSLSELAPRRRHGLVDGNGPPHHAGGSFAIWVHLSRTADQTHGVSSASAGCRSASEEQGQHSGMPRLFPPAGIAGLPRNCPGLIAPGQLAPGLSPPRTAFREALDLFTPHLRPQGALGFLVKPPDAASLVFGREGCIPSIDLCCRYRAGCGPGLGCMR